VDEIQDGDYGLLDVLYRAVKVWHDRSTRTTGVSNRASAGGATG
jgi:hypothetical protein